MGQEGRDSAGKEEEEGVAGREQKSAEPEECMSRMFKSAESGARGCVMLDAGLFVKLGQLGCPITGCTSRWAVQAGSFCCCEYVAGSKGATVSAATIGLSSGRPLRTPCPTKGCI